MANSAPSPTYRIKIRKDALKVQSRLPLAKRKAFSRILREYLAITPLEPIPGKTKKLKGAHKGILQYDIDDRYRIHYTVDTRERLVRIIYVGPHPNW